MSFDVLIGAFFDFLCVVFSGSPIGILYLASSGVSCRSLKFYLAYFLTSCQAFLLTCFHASFSTSILTFFLLSCSIPSHFFWRSFWLCVGHFVSFLTFFDVGVKLGSTACCRSGVRDINFRLGSGGAHCALEFGRGGKGGRRSRGHTMPPEKIPGPY